MQSAEIRTKEEIRIQLQKAKISKQGIDADGQGPECSHRLLNSAHKAEVQMAKVRIQNVQREARERSPMSVFAKRRQRVVRRNKERRGEATGVGRE